MSTQRRVLLARPHPFIVSGMKGLLEQSGFEPTPIASLAELASTDPAGVHGVVISTSITAAEPTEKVLAAVRRFSARLPVIIATLLEFETTRKALAHTILPLVPDAVFVPATAATLARADLGQPNLFVVLRKVEVDDVGRKSAVQAILERHFR